jgi:hypothetical protein
MKVDNNFNGDYVVLQLEPSVMALGHPWLALGPLWLP